MEWQVWLAYLATAIVFSIAPGSGTVNSISNGLSYGVRRSLTSVAGLQVGLSIHIALVGIGIGALVASSAWLFELIKWLGVAYLLYLGISKWREAPPSTNAMDENYRTVLQLFTRSIVVNLTNPKSIVFLVALFPQFIDPNGNQVLQLWVLAITTVVVDSLVMIGYTLLASQMRQFLRSDNIMRKINKLFGSLFIGCGALLASAKSSS